jgi:exodeoxyribonuclease-1
MRDKRKVASLVQSSQSFVYCSGRYPSEFEKATVAVFVADCPKKQGAFVYDLRHNPDEFVDLTPQQLADAWRWKKQDDPGLRLPVKVLQFNRCPAVAPLIVLKQTSAEQLQKLQIDEKTIEANRKKLAAATNFAQKVLEASELLESERPQTQMLPDDLSVDAQLYDGFFGDQDRSKMRVIRAADATELSQLGLEFSDKRLTALLPLYKARNFPKQLTGEERAAWEDFCKRRLLTGGQKSRLAKYFERLQVLAAGEHLTSSQQYSLEELRLYGETVMPVED